MHPFRLDRIEPGAFRREPEREDAHPFADLFDLLVVLSNPGPHDLADVPGGIVPDQQPRALTLRLQALAAPVEKLRSDVAHWSARDKAQPHLLTFWIVPRVLLPQHAIAGQRFGVRIAFFPGLLDQTDWLLLALPGMHMWKRKPAPPDFILKTDGPARLLARPRD